MDYRDYPDVEVPEFLQKEGWDDTSYHNDAMASSTRRLNYAGWIIVWVAEDDPKIREFAGSKKYQVTVWDEERAVLLATLMESDDANEVEDLVSRIQYGDNDAPTVRPATLQGLALFADWVRHRTVAEIRKEVADGK